METDAALGSQLRAPGFGSSPCALSRVLLVSLWFLFGFRVLKTVAGLAVINLL